MKIATHHLSALEALGYTTAEAGFLYLVAAYSGYFLPRQYITFTQTSRGKRSHLFTDKLKSRGHATWREYLNVGGVYHLSSKTLYRQIDRDYPSQPGTSVPGNRAGETELFLSRDQRPADGPTGEVL
jgi:hypothetical protein